VGSVGVLRTQRCHLRAGFQQCQSFVEMGTVRSIVLLLFLQKQNLASAIYLFGLSTLLKRCCPLGRTVPC
jgi:hypothetical protein